MTIREIAKEFKDEIMDGIAWIAIWKMGRSWNAMAFWLNDGRIENDDVEVLKGILNMDENAVFINEYYCAHMGDGTLEDIVKGIRFHYENRYNLLRENEDYTNATEEQEKKEAKDATNEVKDFMQTEAGEEIKKTIREWDQSIDDARKAADIDALMAQDRKNDICGAKWEVFKLMLKQLYGIEFFFTRAEGYFGICTEDEEIFLMKEYRVQEGGKGDAEI